MANLDAGDDGIDRAFDAVLVGVVESLVRLDSFELHLALGCLPCTELQQMQFG